LNSLLYQLIRLKNIQSGYVHYLNEKSIAGEYISYDRDTRIFNRFRVAINKTDFISVFEGRIALIIKGLRVLQHQQIHLDVSVYQVKIEEEEDTKDTSSAMCIFD